MQPRVEDQLETYLPLVRQEAYRLKLRLPEEVDVEELFAAGLRGLIEAVGRYDAGRGVPFSAYARRRVKGAMIDGLRSLDVLPTEMRRKVKQMDALEEAFLKQNGRKPSSVELQTQMAGCGLEPSSRLFWARTMKVQSLQEMEQESKQLVDKEQRDALSRLEVEELLTLVKASISRLNAKEQQVLTLYYQAGLTMKEIALVLGVTESRVCQIHSRCIGFIRQELKGYEKT
jgi:RNA polymerase sigma factor for flagellar operon FliA